ncbi:transcription factor Adf-1-like [Leptopilina boulardi]|uniref:transcription factor Adf-1-like n=1 Tax=Leptopilina boulardi TaxID=63433 RepID=UPI0021F51B01|nr:transcription factor Adf-1-like [Leptopilina boulardi]
MTMQRRAPEKMNCNLLIQEVFARRALWQRNHKHHHNRSILDQHWDEVAECIGSTRDGCRRRWKSLKDNYRRELKKSEETLIKSCWPYYDPLIFLKDQMISSFLADPLEIQPQTKLEIFENSSNDGEKLDNDVQEIDEEIKVFNTIDLMASTSTTRGRRGRKKRQKIIDENETIVNEILTTDEIIPQQVLTNDNIMKENDYENTSESDDYFFFMSLIPHVQNFSSIQKLRLRNKIQQLIIDEASGVNSH